MLRAITFASALFAALGIVAVGAISVSASGHEFVASKTGKVTSKASTAQVFKTGAGTIECNSVTGSGEITALKSTVHKEALTYSECEAFGFIVSISTVKFEFGADGTAKLEKAVTMTPEGAGCSVTIPAQTLSAVTYSNEAGGKLKASATMTHIHSKGSGGTCGGENTEGSYTGKVLATPESGTVEWK